jgi:hypothetical protein
MKSILTILLIDINTGQWMVRDVELPVKKAFENPFRPQFICEIPKGHQVRILGVERKE